MNNPPPQNRKNGKLPTAIWWVTTIAWTLTIYQFSTIDYGDSLTGWLLEEILKLLSIQVSPSAFHSLHIAVRKLAHVTEYAIFALLLYGSLGRGRDFRWVRRRAIFCVVVAAGYSLTDELHQIFVPGRTGSLFDSGLDAIGAMLGMTVIYAFDRMTQAKASSNAASAANPAET